MAPPYRDDRESLAAQLAESQQENEELRKQLAAKRRGLVLLLKMLIVALTFGGPPVIFAMSTMAPVPVQGCYVRDCTDKSVFFGISPHAEVCLYGAAPWAWDVTYGRFDTIEEAICAARQLECPLEEQHEDR